MILDEKQVAEIEKDMRWRVEGILAAYTHNEVVQSLIETLRAAWKERDSLYNNVLELSNYCEGYRQELSHCRKALVLADNVIHNIAENHDNPAKVQFHADVWLYSEERQRYIGDGYSQ